MAKLSHSHRGSKLVYNDWLGYKYIKIDLFYMFYLSYPSTGCISKITPFFKSLPICFKFSGMVLTFIILSEVFRSERSCNVIGEISKKKGLSSTHRWPFIRLVCSLKKVIKDLRRLLNSIRNKLRNAEKNEQFGALCLLKKFRINKKCQAHQLYIFYDSFDTNSSWLCCRWIIFVEA